MRPTSAFLISVPLFLAHVCTAFTGIDCKQDIVVDSRKFDFSKLDSPHSVISTNLNKPPSIFNTTWTVNICRPLKKEKKIPDEEQCPSGTNICGIETSWDPINDPDQKNVHLDSVIPIAGSWGQDSGHTLDPKWTRLKTTDSNAEGLQLELMGRKYNNLKQKAVINFQCDKDRTGNEDNEKDDDKKKRDDDDDDKEDKKDESSLTFVSYGPVEGKSEIIEVLRLNWRTKYACEDYQGDDDTKTGGWGFFTWFILIAFLGIAAYLIFGSWLNYNRYGARGWDLLPHGDTIRDIPYLVKDWSRKVVDTVSSGGSRGGYSAV